MDSESLTAENERLRKEVEEHRKRELEQLRSALAEAIRERDHYRKEATRNAEIGRTIAAEAEAERSVMQRQLGALNGSGGPVNRRG